MKKDKLQYVEQVIIKCNYLLFYKKIMKFGTLLSLFTTLYIEERKNDRSRNLKTI